MRAASGSSSAGAAETTKGSTTGTGIARNIPAAARASTCGSCGYEQVPWSSHPWCAPSAGGQYGQSWLGGAATGEPAWAITHGSAAACSHARTNSASTALVRTRWRCLTQFSPMVTLAMIQDCGATVARSRPGGKETMRAGRIAAENP